MTTAITISLGAFVVVLIVVDVIRKAKAVSKTLAARPATDRSRIPNHLTAAFDVVLDAIQDDSGLDRAKICLDDKLSTLGYGYDWADDGSLDLCNAIHDRLKIDQPTRSFTTIRDAVEYANLLLKEFSSSKLT